MNSNENNALALTNWVSNPRRPSMQIIILGGAALAVGIAAHYQPELLDPDTQNGLVWLDLGLYVVGICVVALAAAGMRAPGGFATRVHSLGALAQELGLLGDVILCLAVVQELRGLEPALAPTLRGLTCALIAVALSLSITTLAQCGRSMCGLHWSKFPPTRSPPDCP